MDRNKQAEFERTLETYADSFLKTDNPRLIYEMAYTEVSMRHGRPKLAPKEVKLNEETAARTLYRLIADADDPERLDINNAMKEVYRTLGDSSFPYQQELQAAIHEKLPVIESKLEAAVEQQEIQRRMRSESKVTPEELYEHIGVEPEIVSDALFGKKGKELVVYAFSQAAEKISNDNITDFISIHNKHFEIAFNDLFEEFRANRAEKGRFIFADNMLKADHDRLSSNAEKVAVVTAALEFAGSPADKAIAQRMLETPRAFVYREGRADKFTRLDTEWKIKNLLKKKTVEVENAIKTKITDDPDIDVLAVDHAVRNDIHANSKEYRFQYEYYHQEAAYIKHFEKNFFEQITATPFCKHAFSAALSYDDMDKKRSPIIEYTIYNLKEKRLISELANVIDEKYNIDSSNELSDEAFEKVLDTCYRLVREHNCTNETVRAVAEEAVEAEHETIENDIGKDMTD